MIVVPFIESHIHGFNLQKDQLFMNRYLLDPEYVRFMAESGFAYTGIVDGVPVAISGMFLVHPHIGNAWALLSDRAYQHLLPITKAIKQFLEGQNIKRIEVAVKHDFKEGHRWAKMLGFENETPNGMRAYGIDGETYDLYARIR